MRYAVAISILTLAMHPRYASSAEFSGIPATYAMIPQEIIRPIPIEITTDQFRARLKSGGTLTLDGNTLDLTPSISNKIPVAFMALDRLELKNGASIISNGAAVLIIANTISSENGKIISFDQSHTKAARGLDSNGPGVSGNVGSPGLGGGVVSLQIIQKLEGILNIDLRGQDGGDGSDGQKGETPQKAGRGTDAQDGPGGWIGVGDCKRGGGDGQAGFKGLQGGTAGVGGPGGDGGYFQMISVGSEPLPSSSFTFSAKGGTAGKVGNPGPGGQGGEGGEGGNGSTWCSGGRGGSQGPLGDRGRIPEAARPGREGNLAVKNLDIEIAIRTSILNAPH